MTGGVLIMCPLQCMETEWCQLSGELLEAQACQQVTHQENLSMIKQSLVYATPPHPIALFLSLKRGDR